MSAIILSFVKGVFSVVVFETHLCPHTLTQVCSSITKFNYESYQSNCGASCYILSFYSKGLYQPAEEEEKRTRE